MQKEEMPDYFGPIFTPQSTALCQQGDHVPRSLGEWGSIAQPVNLKITDYWRLVFIEKCMARRPT